MRASLLAFCLAPALAAAAGEPVVVLRAETGTFEEAFALDGAGGRLALVRAGSGGATELEVVNIDQKGATLVRFPLGEAAPVSLALSSAGIFVVTRSPDGATTEGALHDTTGKLLRRFGPATDLMLADHGGKEVVAAYTARPGAIEVTLHDPRGARPTLKRTLAVDAAGAVTALELTPNHWRGGYAQLVGRRQGRYDKAKDRLMNDTEAVYDVAKGTIVRDGPIGDLMLFARLQRERARRWNQDSFVHVEDGARLVAVTAEDRVVTLDVPMAIYDAASLQQQQLPDGRVVFSLTVDPLNPEAMERKKRDLERIDVFRFEPGAAEAARPARLLELARGGRDFVWRASATRLAVLRKHRTYGRGGPEIEIYELSR